MVRIDIAYLGDLRCRAVHGPSSEELITDAPIDNQGKGENFSPTDLVATAVGTCVMTIMGIVARRNHIDITGLRAAVEKEMTAEPVRRIGKVRLKLIFARRPSEQELAILLPAIESCPVMNSLASEVEIEREVSFAEAVSNQGQ